MSTELHKLDIERLHQAFSPAQAISDPHLFVGRRDEINIGIRALANPGSLICIYGLRGVGKSSIANQLSLIAQGHTEVPALLKLERSLPRHGFNFLVHFVRGDDFIQDITQLVTRLLFGDDKNPSLFSLTSSGGRYRESYTEIETKQATLGAKAALEAQANIGGSRQITYKDYVSDDEIQLFRQLIGAVHKDNQKRSGLLILIDEFDRIRNKNGFAALVRACSDADPYVKFGIIGIASDISELIEDHQSLIRVVDMIHVPRMPSHELRQILELAEFRVDYAIQFTENAKDVIVNWAEGFPYFVHLLGREAMLMAFDTHNPFINDAILTTLIRKVNEGRLIPSYEGIYQKAVRNAPQRELALKAYADIDHDEISISVVHNTLKGLGIGNPSRLTRELVDEGILVQPWKGYYRFVDPVFKVYARLRNWKF